MAGRHASPRASRRAADGSWIRRANKHLANHRPDSESHWWPRGVEFSRLGFLFADVRSGAPVREYSLNSAFGDIVSAYVDDAQKNIALASRITSFPAPAENATAGIDCCSLPDVTPP